MSLVVAWLVVGSMACVWECFCNRRVLHLSLLAFLTEISKQLAAKKVELPPNAWKKMAYGWTVGTYGAMFVISVFIWPCYIYRDVRKAFKKEDGTLHE